MIPRKGFDILLSAVALMKERNCISLSIVGHGPERTRLEKQVQQFGIGDQVRFLGELPPPEMPSFFSNIDLFVLSSRSEGRPNVVIEALAAGTPVVSTDLPGVVDLVDPGSSGWVVGQEDPQAMAAALDEACSDPARLLLMGRAGREKMRTDGGWMRAANEYQCIFDRVIDAYRGVG
jgi:glycosyltransferase involved in cell wall biosynthesis